MSLMVGMSDLAHDWERIGDKSLVWAFDDADDIQALWASKHYENAKRVRRAYCGGKR